MPVNISDAKARRRGNAVIELAFILLPFCGLLFLLADVSLALFMRATLQHAAREAARYAVTSQTLNGMGHDASIRAVAQRNAMGLLDGSEGLSKIQIRYYTPDTLEETASNDGGNIVEVSIENFNYTPMAPVLHSGERFQIRARSSDRMEMQVGGQAPVR